MQITFAISVPIIPIKFSPSSAHIITCLLKKTLLDTTWINSLPYRLHFWRNVWTPIDAVLMFRLSVSSCLKILASNKNPSGVVFPNWTNWMVKNLKLLIECETTYEVNFLQNSFIDFDKHHPTIKLYEGLSWKFAKVFRIRNIKYARIPFNTKHSCAQYFPHFKLIHLTLINDNENSTEYEFVCVCVCG